MGDDLKGVRRSYRTGMGAAVAIAGAVLFCLQPLFCQQALADTLESALAYAYVNNPQINSQRAVVRATDEGVPTALAGYRPRATATANIGTQSLSTTLREIGSTTPPGAPASYFTQSGVNTPHGAGVTVTQNLLNGFQTTNRTRLAESQVFAARETLRGIEQTVLLNAATAYMNLLREAGVLELQRSNLEVLQEQLRQTKARLESGNVTATDVSQSEARLNVGRTQLFVRGQLCELARGVPAGDRARSGPAFAGSAGRPLHAAHVARRHRGRHRAKSHRHHGAAQRRHRRPSGQGRRGRALSDLVAARQRAEEL